jgi:predicted RNA-binding protein associated with RNAse of E/G family
MRRIAVGAFAAALFAAPALASMADVDTDGDNMASFSELRTVYTDIYEDLFAEIDTNGDEFVDEAELAEALKAGLLTGKDE